MMGKAKQKRDQAALQAAVPDQLEKGTSLWADAWHRLRKNRLAFASFVVFIAIVLFCVLGPLFVPYPSNFQVLEAKNARPGEVLFEYSEERSSPATGVIVEPAKPTRRSLSDALYRFDAPFGIEVEAARGSLSPEARALFAEVFGVSESELRNLPEDAPERFRAYLEREGSLTYETEIRGLKSIRTYEPSPAFHLFGLDHLGRDLLIRVMEGGRVSLFVGLLATLVSLVIGISYGAIAGYFGGRVDALMMRIVDAMYALPFTIFVILLMVLFGRELWLIFIAIGAVEWLTMARIVRGQVLSLKKQEFVEAAQSLGLPSIWIIFRHLLPNALGPVVVYTTLTVPSVMLLEAFLSFLGLGVQAPLASWGVLIKDGADRMDPNVHLLLFPALLFSLTLFCLNFLGDGLRDALDPRISKE